MNLLRLTAFLVVVAFSTSSVVKSPSNKGTFELLILHNNDMHARFEQTSQLSGTCTTVDREAGKCYGGFPRVAHVVKEARKAASSGEGPPVLYLNAGDTYTGTAWFTIYKWKIAAEFLNALQPDAVSLGNSDLDKRSANASSILNNLDAPIIATNVIINNNDINRNIVKSLIIDIEGTKVGLVGYLTPENNILNNPGDIEYIDELVALKDEVDKLKGFNVNIIIALGHSDSNKDMEIARYVDGLDLIISGHKNKFYWTGVNVDPELPKIMKPYSVTQASGRIVLVAHSFSYDKYLGQLKVNFDNNGEIVDFNSSPVLLDYSSPQDKDSVEIVNKMNAEISRTLSEVVGSTAVVLDGGSCKTAECNLGNLITDAIAYHHALQSNDVWTNAPIAIIHAGAIFSSIAPTDRPATITKGNLMEVLPTESNLVTVTMDGTILKQVLEHAVADDKHMDRFLQFSGIRVVYNLNHEAGSRVTNAVARSSGFVPEYYLIEDNLNYTVLMPASLANGEFGYSMLHELEKTELPYDEITCLADYIQQRSPVYPEVASRIVFKNSSSFNFGTNTKIVVILLSLMQFFFK